MAGVLAEGLPPCLQSGYVGQAVDLLNCRGGFGVRSLNPNILAALVVQGQAEGVAEGAEGALQGVRLGFLHGALDNVAHVLRLAGTHAHGGAFLEHIADCHLDCA